MLVKKNKSTETVQYSKVLLLNGKKWSWFRLQQKVNRKLRMLNIFIFILTVMSESPSARVWQADILAF